MCLCVPVASSTVGKVFLSHLLRRRRRRRRLPIDVVPLLALLSRLVVVHFTSRRRAATHCRPFPFAYYASIWRRITFSLPLLLLVRRRRRRRLQCLLPFQVHSKQAEPLECLPARRTSANFNGFFALVQVETYQGRQTDRHSGKQADRNCAARLHPKPA